MSKLQVQGPGSLLYHVKTWQGSRGTLRMECKIHLYLTGDGREGGRTGETGWGKNREVACGFHSKCVAKPLDGYNLRSYT